MNIKPEVLAGAGNWVAKTRGRQMKRAGRLLITERVNIAVKTKRKGGQKEHQIRDDNRWTQSCWRERSYTRDWERDKEEREAIDVWKEAHWDQINGSRDWCIETSKDNAED